MGSASDVDRLLEERPDLRPALETALEADEPWRFDDVDIDSGSLGELVSQDIIRKGENGYRLANRDHVLMELQGGFDKKHEREVSQILIPQFSKFSKLELALLVGSLVLVASFRLLSLSNVFVDGHVVLSSNDPYYYRFLVDQLLENPEVSPWNLPAGVSTGEPLMVVTLWIVSVTLGGTMDVAGHVLAWYPVVSAIITAILVYLIAIVITNDKRIGVAAVLTLAIVPVHAFRTSLGFADHHAFDYPWLALTVLSVALLIRVDRRRDNWDISGFELMGVVFVGIGLAGQTLSWDNSPILLFPLAVFIPVEAVRSVYQKESPARVLLPIIGGIALGTALVWMFHSTYSWQSLLVVMAPLLIVLGAIGVLISHEAIHRLELPWKSAILFDITGIIGLVVLTILFRPDYWNQLIFQLTSRLMARREIAEVQGLFGESLGWLLLFGLTLLLALPYLVWAIYRGKIAARWLVVGIYGLYFLILAGIQGRFAGQLSIFVAFFGGLGFVHLAERINGASLPVPFSEMTSAALEVPETRKVVSILLLFILIGSLSFIQIPVKTSQITTPVEQSRTAFWMADYSQQNDMKYPENYVLSNWGDNRMYNYFVNGQSQSYSYAQANFIDFVSSTDSRAWNRRFSDQVGLIVITSKTVGSNSQLGTKLYEFNGSMSGNQQGIGHYQLVYVSPEANYKVFRVVQGAVIQGWIDPERTAFAKSNIKLSQTNFVYQRRIHSNSTGWYRIRVANPGTYSINGKTITVTEHDVHQGRIVDAG